MKYIRNRTVLFTGFPGFIGKWLIKELIKQGDSIKIYALVVHSVADKANREIENDSRLSDKVETIIGDISKPKLGFNPQIYNKLTNEVTDIFHLAAIYHLEVPKELAWSVNVIGTFNMIQFALKCPNLFCFVHFSSMVAAGRKRGKIPEDELDTNVSMHENHYEITKFASEYLIRKYSNRIPLIIIRPAAVIGDSETGVTEKFDGYYHLFEMGKGGRNLGALLPRIHVKDSTLKVPIVPVDYIARATAHVSNQEACIGHGFHLGNFNLPINQFFDIILGKKSTDPVFYIPNQLITMVFHSRFYRFLIKNKLVTLLLRKGFQIPVEILQTVDYYDKAEFSTENSKKYLEPAGISCPKFRKYAEKLFEFQKKNRKKRRFRR